MPEWLRRLLRVEPGISLAQWVFDRISNNWERIIAAFVAGGGMTYLASITEWIKAWGPAGIGAAGLLAALAAWVGLAWASRLRGDAQLRLANATAIEKWKEQVDTVNPLAKEFHTKRVKLSDLMHPVTSRVKGKRFIDCQIMGPANLLIIDNVTITGVGFANCDVVVARPAQIRIFNVLALEDVQIFGGEIIGCTIIIQRDLVPTFQQMGVKFLTLTGVPAIDNLEATSSPQS